MADNQQVGYEDLLRPIKDVLLKNWSMSLAHVLDEFLSHLQQEDAMNFTQAAYLLQNSTTLYCKRVDVVFRIMEELSDGISQLYSLLYNAIQRLALAPNEVAPGVSPAKKRRLARSLEDDDLELLDFVYCEHNLDMNLSKIDGDVPLKQVVLNKDMKVLKKPEVGVPLHDPSEVFIGYKDDFRLYGKTWSDGTLNGDFSYRNASVQYWRGSSDDEMNGHSSDSANCVDDDEDNNMDVENPSTSDSVESASVSASVSVDKHSAHQLKELKVRLPKVQVEDWEPATFNFKYGLKILKRKRVFQLPKQLIEEAEVSVAKQKKRKLSLEKRATKLLNAASAAQNNIAAPVQENGAADESLDEGIDLFCEGDEHSVNGSQSGDDLASFKLQRREKGVAASEIAKRVSEWHEAVIPWILESEKRRKFNVHEYGSRILDRFHDEDTDPKPFEDIIQGLPRYEISRYFLSTLMLANTYNIQIFKTDDTPLAINCIELKLLSKVRHRDEMDEQIENLS